MSKKILYNWDLNILEYDDIFESVNRLKLFL